MAALITVKCNGKTVGRCDANCYNAEHENCSCVCGGANHGAGLNEAISNTQIMFDDWIENYQLKFDDRLDFDNRANNIQMALFK
jgi:hypothetical protein